MKTECTPLCYQQHVNCSIFPDKSIPRLYPTLLRSFLIVSYNRRQRIYNQRLTSYFLTAVRTHKTQLHLSPLSFYFVYTGCWSYIKQMGNRSLVIVKQEQVSVKLIFPFRSKGNSTCASPETLVSSGGTAPRILNCGNRWRCAVRFTPCPLYRTARVTGTRQILGWVGPHRRS